MSRKAQFAFAFLALLGFAQPLAAAEVWFGPNDDLHRGAKRDIVLNQDFPHLFDPNPAWSADIDVFQMSPEMAAIGPEDELMRVVGWLKARRIQLGVGVEATMVDGVGPANQPCGAGVEGSRPPGQNALIFAKLKRLGVDVAYLSLDEPLTYGHYYSGRAACHYPIAEVARRVAASLAEIRPSYPDVRFVDDEAPQPVPVEQWRADVETWLNAFRAAVGRPVDAIVFDVDLFRDWRPRVAAGMDAARRQGVRSGIYLINAGRSATDAQAVAGYGRAAERIDASRLRFDIVKVANWTPQPFANLPQSDPSTLTYVLDQWNRAHRRR